MPELILWKNQHIKNLKKDIDNMFDRVCGDYGIASAHRVIRRRPSFEMTDIGNAILLIAGLPGIDPDALKLTVTGDLITLSCHVQGDIIKEGHSYYRTFDSFTRSIKMPCPIVADRVEAVYENGILKVILPKAPQEKPMVIMIRKIIR